MSSIADTGAAGGRARPATRQLAAAGVFGVLFCGGFVWSLSIGPESIGVWAIVQGTFVPNHTVPSSSST